MGSPAFERDRKTWRDTFVAAAERLPVQTSVSFGAYLITSGKAAGGLLHLSINEGLSLTFKAGYKKKGVRNYCFQQWHPALPN